MGAMDKITTVVSTKGQVILPKPVRDRRRWAAGTRLTVEETPDGVLLRPMPAFAPTEIEQAFGCLRREGPALSLEEMDAALIREAKRRARD